MLTAKSPEMVSKYFWAHLLGYNLLRSIMEQAARLAAYQPPRLSLQGTRQGFTAILTSLAMATKQIPEALYADLLGGDCNGFIARTS